MKNSDQKVIYMLWSVIAVLVIGAAVGGFLLARKTDELSQTNTELTGSNNSLRNQLQQKLSPTPTPGPSLPESTGSQSPAPKPSATPTPSPTISATPQP